MLQIHIRPYHKKSEPVWRLEPVLTVLCTHSSENPIFNSRNLVDVPLKTSEIGCSYLLTWSPHIVNDNPLVLENLQSLSRLRIESCTQQAFKSLPNLKKLSIHQTKGDLAITESSSSFLNKSNPPLSTGDLELLFLIFS